MVWARNFFRRSEFPRCAMSDCAPWYECVPDSCGVLAFLLRRKAAFLGLFPLARIQADGFLTFLLRRKPAFLRLLRIQADGFLTFLLRRKPTFLGLFPLA